MGDCRDINFLEGGTIKDATIIDSTFSNGVVRDSDIVNARLTGGIAADAETAQDLADIVGPLVIASLPVSPDAPLTGEEASLPTTLAGGRGLILGEPAAWIQWGEYLVPLYTRG